LSSGTLYIVYFFLRIHYRSRAIYGVLFLTGTLRKLGAGHCFEAGRMFRADTPGRTIQAVITAKKGEKALFYA